MWWKTIDILSFWIAACLEFIHFRIKWNCIGIKTASTLVPIIYVWKIPDRLDFMLYMFIFRFIQTDWRNSPEQPDQSGSWCVQNTKCSAFISSSLFFLTPFAYAITWFWQWLHTLQLRRHSRLTSPIPRTHRNENDTTKLRVHSLKIHWMHFPLSSQS